MAQHLSYREGKGYYFDILESKRIMIDLSPIKIDRVFTFTKKQTNGDLNLYEISHDKYSPEEDLYLKTIVERFNILMGTYWKINPGKLQVASNFLVGAMNGKRYFKCGQIVHLSPEIEVKSSGLHEEQIWVNKARGQTFRLRIESDYVLFEQLQ